MAGLEVEGNKKRVMGTEEAIGLLIQELMNPSGLKMMTDLNDEETGVLSLLSTIGEQFKIEEINKFVENFSKFRISRFRLGRRESVEIATYSQMPIQSGGKRSLKDLFVGVR